VRIILVAILVALSCVPVFAQSTKTEQKKATILIKDQLDPKDEAFLASLPEHHYTNKDITLPNGENLQAYIDKHPQEFKPNKVEK